MKRRKYPLTIRRGAEGETFQVLGMDGPAELTAEMKDVLKMSIKSMMRRRRGSN